MNIFLDGETAFFFRTLKNKLKKILYISDEKLEKDGFKKNIIFSWFFLVYKILWMTLKKPKKLS